MAVANTNTSQTALRALSVLELMSEAAGPVTVAARINADQSTALSASRRFLFIASSGAPMITTWPWPYGTSPATYSFYFSS